MKKIGTTTEQGQTVEKVVEEITADDEGTVVMEALENESKELIDEEISLEGKVFIEEDRIRVQGTTNLIEGTVLMGRLFHSPFSDTKRGSTRTNKHELTTVNADGTFAMNFLFSEFSNRDFLEVYDQSDIEVLVEVHTRSGSRQDDEILAVYGEFGENFTGPFVHQYQYRNDVMQRIYAPVHVFIGGDVTEYEITAPNWEPLPDDYGETEIWIDIDITNDHRFFYVKGKSLEGTKLEGGYYSNPTRLQPQDTFRNQTFVLPDGTFLLRVAYRDITEEGFIYIHSRGDYQHNPRNTVREVYGENFEHLSGDYVVAHEDGVQKIEITFAPELPQINVPNEAEITTEDEEVKVQVPDDVLFDFDKSELKQEAQVVLNELIELLQGLDKGTVIEINGHTDNQGDPNYNMNLSEQRAAAVEAYLNEYGDFSHLSMTTKGYGLTKPIASNGDKEGQARNRRVEIVINPKE